MSLTVYQVTSSRQMAQFINLAGHVRRSVLSSLTPEDRQEEYNPAFNPVLRHIETGYFIAFRGDRPAGRIAALRDFLNPQEDTGFFGCFECLNDPQAASELLKHAAKWLSGRGLETMIGPATFNTNQRVGLLIEDGEAGQQLTLPYNPSYYPGLVESAGLEKLTDLLTFSWYPRMGVPERVSSIAARARRNTGTFLRRLNPFHPMEAGSILGLFNLSMAANWGYIPLTYQEAAGIIRFAVLNNDPDLSVIAFMDHQPAGFCLSLPVLAGPDRSGQCRAAVMGVVPGFRLRGLESLMIEYILQTCAGKGYEMVDISQVHEDNAPMIRIITRVIGAKQTRRYRVYRKKL